jgi:predicted GNAT superfamily acetyltransferase
MSPEITIRRAETIADYRACQDAQRRAWGISEEHYVVPVATMVGAQHHGGVVLGAFLPGGEAAGMSFAFLGRTEGRICLYSQLTGVVPGYQDQGIGYRLKTTQRAIAHAEDVPCIAWAFDPLQAGNARFNLDKLGTTAGRYIPNMYGARSDALNRNSPTDRLIAVWETGPDSPRVLVATDNDDLPRAIAIVHATEGDDAPAFAGLPGNEPRILLEIPTDINRLRSEAPERAEHWGSVVREAFLAAFAAGYRAVGFHRVDSSEGQRGFYVLVRPEGAVPAPTGSSIQRT